MLRNKRLILALLISVGVALVSVSGRLGPSYRQLRFRLSGTVSVNGDTMRLDPSDSVITPFMVETGTWEPTETAIFREHTGPGDTVIDVGANVGYYTLLGASLVGEEGRVIAFEPDPAAFDLLMGNVASNGYRNVTLEQKAVSNEEGTLDLYIAEANKGDHRIYQPGGREHVEVETVSLDGYLANSPGRVDFLKIDTQGAEGAILAGAIDTLTRNQDIVLVVEFWPASMRELGYDPAAVLETLTDLGFHLSYIDEQFGTVTPVDARMVLKNLTVENKKWSNLLCKR